VSLPRPRPYAFEPVEEPEVGRRRLVVLDVVEGAAFARAVWRVAPAIERSLGPEVLANRAGRLPGTLLPWRPAWARRCADIERQLDAAAGPVVVVADVRRCYPSIGFGTLERALRRLRIPGPDVAAILSWQGWFRDGGVEGLPVGPEPSAVLANAVLTIADQSLRENGTPFRRWVDDIVAFSPDRRRAIVALDGLHRALSAAGLELNDAKTRVVVDRDEARAVLLRRRCSLAAGSDVA
jgi:hypothetical protein